ncbi:beta-N-acetylhexosaminidase [Algicola sagamiensis]|uniref:beta-N-acetylhexosaminidase n=1 Tax=Algicola sagamiensis TaxID=163869 RepID=UPI00037CACC5|nr:beta-N-acetylhexosaminidase [Algicola sagamiensis]
MTEQTGFLFLDFEGYELSAEEKEMLAHPSVGGAILFTRNYHDREQLFALVKSVRVAANQEVILAVDHEGGRVQRFREGFTALPAPGQIFESASSMEEACLHAKEIAWLMAAELRTVDIDLSFAPVLDLNRVSDVIGTRAFDNDPEHVIKLATSWIEGMQEVGMKATGKHFPGHGSVKEDSHHFIPIDQREKQHIFHEDMRVFEALIAQKLLDGMMPAHVIYPAVDQHPAGFSPVWLQDILRSQLGFEGVIFSDDLSMEGATSVGSYTERAFAALEAGCDMLLACNHRAGSIEILDNVTWQKPRQNGLVFRNTTAMTHHTLTTDKRWQSATRLAEKLK